MLLLRPFMIMTVASVAAALALGRIRHHRALPALIKALEDEDHSFRRQVSTALGHIGSAEATKALITAIKIKGDGRSCDVYAPMVIVAMWQEAHPGRYNEPASWALTQIGPPAVKDLATALNDPAGTTMPTSPGRWGRSHWNIGTPQRSRR